MQPDNVHSPSNIQASSRIEIALSRAIERDELELHYQPQVDLRSGRIDAVEALVRWRHPELGDVPPARFIPLAEKLGLIGVIGEWVIRQACTQGRLWKKSGLPPIRIAINVSAKQLDNPRFSTLIADSLSDNELDPTFLELEFTESVAIGSLDRTIPMMHMLKELGVSLSIDDFGTGFSNMNYLRQFPLDRLKLDGSFVRGITTDPRSLAIAEAIIVMSHRLGLQVVAERVETEGQVVCLANRNCDHVQGNYFSPALSGDACARLLRTGSLPVPNQDPGNPERILLALDDEPQVTAALKRELRFEGYRILCTDRVDEALELLARHPVGVVLCDLKMPQSGGLEFLGKVKTMLPNTVRLILSGDNDFVSARSAINHGAVYKFLSKPWDSRELKTVILDAFELHEWLLQESLGPEVACGVSQLE